MVSWPLKYFTSPWKKLNRDKECFWLCRRQQMLHKGTSQGDYDINFTDKTILLNSFLLRWRVHLHKYMMKFELHYNVKENDYLRKWLNKDIQRSILIDYITFFGICELFLVFILPNDFIVLSCLTTFSIYDTEWRIKMSNSLPNQHLK